MRLIIFASMLLSALSLPASADEDTIKLKVGEGREAIEQN